ncbi:protein NUCLEAR FUSION DEFECTIVE 4 isoform X1 [Hevea brasiliensis]|uniref:protein NUCLEAR FUSION DEFECTIVE 4 isoform X1 n=1 Tax=Hevea brasiliensis TaxID=3981 RepID=UPI0025EF2FAF|nr:protein NUCLEAR FUSION DEFECTIVE 4 isoform X1 [Hevea brasiliensis]XP_021686293.2 protein NUCLEAR FUSION DEFECTIVE 4 isoform X1 [Hevea brasiliensis]XP_021686294.2 protein NUCLEAR FUSION DEFECTIVE 4 isoform X1 [Hevea brasiliensis]
MKAGTRPPWIGLGVAVWVQIASGNAYSFPLYSHSLKSVLGFNQHQLTMVGVANDIGENIGLLPGIASNKFPPWAILLIGAFACFIGYGVLWLALSRAVQSMPYWLLWLALCVATNSSAWLSTAVLVTNMRNFPLSRGTVAGILKGYGGISAAVFTAIYSMLLHSSSSKLLMFLALGIPVLCFLVMYFVRACTPASGEDSTEHAYFLFTQAALIALSLYILITTILDHMLHLSAPISYTFPVIMFVLLMAPLAIPIKMTFCCTRTSKSGMLDRSIASSDNLIQGEASADKTEPLLKSSSSALILGSFQESDETSVAANMLLAEGEGAVKKKRRPKRGEDFKFSEAVIKADFWLLFFVYFVGVGSGVTVLNNLAQIGIAQGVHDTTILLSLFSFCNFVGRLGGGTVSEHFVRSKTIPRTIWMTCTQIIMIVTYLLFASAIDGTLYAATALLGICFGVQFSVMIPTVSELFGLKHFGIFYNFMSLGNPLGAYLFSGLLAGYVYDTEAAKQQELNMLLGSSISCMGPHCFRLTFLVLAGVCGVGSILSLILTMRIWPVYEMLYAGGSFRLPQSSIH